jgi:hypothetical protein
VRARSRKATAPAEEMESEIVRSNGRVVALVRVVVVVEKEDGE